MTGNASDLEKGELAKELAKDRLIRMGSGTTAENIADFLKYAEGLIVGYGLKDDSHLERPMYIEKVKRFIQALVSVR